MTEAVFSVRLFQEPPPVEKGILHVLFNLVYLSWRSQSHSWRKLNGSKVVWQETRLTLIFVTNGSLQNEKCKPREHSWHMTSKAKPTYLQFSPVAIKMTCKYLSKFDNSLFTTSSIPYWLRHLYNVQREQEVGVRI